jgi:hypothetical protein
MNMVSGRLAVAATLSDLLGTGALPKAVLVAVTVPHGYATGRFKRLMQGVEQPRRRNGALQLLVATLSWVRYERFWTAGIGVAGSEP